jgi:hypothetical protein
MSIAPERICCYHQHVLHHHNMHHHHIGHKNHRRKRRSAIEEKKNITKTPQQTRTTPEDTKCRELESSKSIITAETCHDIEVTRSLGATEECIENDTHENSEIFDNIESQRSSEGVDNKKECEKIDPWTVPSICYDANIWVLEQSSGRKTMCDKSTQIHPSEFRENRPSSLWTQIQALQIKVRDLQHRAQREVERKGWRNLQVSPTTKHRACALLNDMLIRRTAETDSDDNDSVVAYPGLQPFSDSSSSDDDDIKNGGD